MPRISAPTSAIIVTTLWACGATEPDDVGVASLGAAAPTSSARYAPPTTNAPPPPPTGLPELPAVRRDVLNFGTHTSPGPDFAYPHVPPFRLSADGRIALTVSGGKMYVYSPEMMSQRLSGGPNGVKITDATTQFTSLPAFHATTMTAPRLQMSTICDGTRDGPVSKRRNPYPCGTNGANDCYDLTILSTVEGTVASVKHMEIWGRDVTIEVAQPKTANPTIVSAQAGLLISSPRHAIRSLWEPLATEDGYLFVGRASFSSISYPTSGGQQSGSYDIVYAVYDETPTNRPCDVTQWTQFYPVSHAHHHASMRGRYGFAEYPLTDPEGAPIPDGAELKATYQWIDRQGRNLFFTTLNERFHYYSPPPNSSVFTRYPARCVPGYSCPLFPSHTAIQQGDIEATFHYQGVAMAGLWTHGRVVTVDGVLNNVDFNLYVGKENRRVVQLYADGSGPSGAPTSGWVEMGNGRADGSRDPTGYLERPPLTHPNINVIDSIENRLNYSKHITARSPRDVVWLVSNGKGMQEVEFDDYLDVDALIVSNMTASLSHAAPHPQDFSTMRYRDGFRTTNSTGPIYGHGRVDEVRFQNGASSPLMTVPPFGLADPNVRVEPVALGGVEGKGAWLDGVSGIRYTIPAQTADQMPLSSRDWYVGLFVDQRQTNHNYAAELVALPDGSSIFLYDAAAVAYRSAAGAIFVHYLPAAATYTTKHYNHLGFAIRDGGRTVDFYLNGFLFGTSTDPAPILQIVPGDLVFGRDAEPLGFRGWIDEIKVIGRRPSPELACNYARGYLIGMNDPADPHYARAGAYPASSHARISNLMHTDQFDRFYCVHDYDDAHGMPADLPTASLSAGSRRISAELLFPEGPLVYSQPRPDSTNNAFCLDCHHAALGGTLGLGALTSGGSTPMGQDPRRQPSFAPWFQSGNFPAGFFGPGLPSAPVSLSSGGHFFDPFLFP